MNIYRVKGQNYGGGIDPVTSMCVGVPHEALVVAEDEAGAKHCLTSGSDSAWLSVESVDKIGEIELDLVAMPYDFCYSYSGGGYPLKIWPSKENRAHD